MDEWKLKILKRQADNHAAEQMLSPEDRHEEDVLLERDRDRADGVVYIRERKNR